MFGSIDFGVKIRCFEGLDLYSNAILYINKDGFKLFTGNKLQFFKFTRRFVIDKFGDYFDDVN